MVAEHWGNWGQIPIFHLGKAFDGTGWRPSKRLPAARELGEMSIMFLVHPTLTEAKIAKTCSAIENVMGLAGK
jgi:dTDP-4-amino-4,6-dideoxygalactose transaminase